MDERSKKFLRRSIPEHLVRLLELYGVVCLEDVSILDAEILKDVEDYVKEGKFEDQQDFESPPVREKFLGSKVIDVTNFSIKALDKKRLMVASAAAREAMKAFKESRTPAVRQKHITFAAVTKPIPKSEFVGTNQTSESNEDEEYQEEEKPAKRKKYEGNTESARSAITSKLLALANDAWASINLTEKVKKSDIQIEYCVASKKWKGTVRCLICSESYCICYRPDSITIPSFKRHIKRMHLNLKSEDSFE